MTFSFDRFFIILLAANCLVRTTSAQSNTAFDFDLYENVLDPVQCARQLDYIRNNASNIRTLFMDASWRIPRNILKGNTRDTGNYFPCLDISEEGPDNVNIEGKYCVFRIPFDQEEFELPTIPVIPNITWPETPPPEPMLKFPWQQLDLTSLYTKEMREKFNRFEKVRHDLRYWSGSNGDDTSRAEYNIFSGMTFELAVCIPKACTTREAMDFFTNNLTSTITYTDRFCRLPNDKTWVPADTVAVVLLSIIGLATVLSTTYDIRHTVILERDPKHVNKWLQSFSIFTNTRNFFVFPAGPSVVTCLDGIRSLAMMWVIVGHTFVNQLSSIPENISDMFDFMFKYSSLWISSATITVDTFFMISGILIIYTTASKVTRSDLLKNLHLFYLNRLLRMFPVLAASVLMVASFMHRLTDGPYFDTVSNWVNNCRSNWWSTLLYVQNFLHPENMCLAHSWYLSIDIHLYLISPIVLFWVLGQSKRSSWCALIAALLTILIVTTVYNFIHNFQSHTVAFGRPAGDGLRYMHNYYFHTLPRATPFFVGMIYGYMLHLYRGKTIQIPKPLVFIFWLLAFAGLGFVCSLHYWVMQYDWDNQFLDNLINSFKRPTWAACVGWLIFACHKGYGGPINWLLSLHIFKIIGRLSYAMYILHYPLQFLVLGTALTPIYFSISYSLYRFVIDFTIAMIGAFLMNIFIDLPVSNLIKLTLEGKKRKPKEKPAVVKENPDVDFKSLPATNGDEKKTNHVNS